MPHRFVWMLLVSLAVTHAASSQCYDLRSTRLYEAKGRYQEWWDKPLWGGQTGNENFHIDEPSWGRLLHFALFDLGVIRKTPEGWISYRAKRSLDTWCDPTPERSGVLCYAKPYQQPPPEAKIHAIFDAVETWALDKAGVVHFRYHDDQGVPSRIENRSDYKLLPHEFGLDGKDETDATLDLNSGAYHFESHQYFDGAYIRRYPGTGVKLWRIDTFHAQTVLYEVPCPSLLKESSVDSTAIESIELKAVQTCVVKMREAKPGEKPSEPWEFVLNINQVSSPDHCIQVFESPKPDRPSDIPVTSADSREVHPKK